MTISYTPSNIDITNKKVLPGTAGAGVMTVPFSSVTCVLLGPSEHVTVGATKEGASCTPHDSHDTTSQGLPRMSAGCSAQSGTYRHQWTNQRTYLMSMNQSIHCNTTHPDHLLVNQSNIDNKPLGYHNFPRNFSPQRRGNRCLQFQRWSNSPWNKAPNFSWPRPSLPKPMP